MATVRDPAVGPRRQTQARPPTAKDTSASAGSPTHFQPCTASHKGYFDSGEDPRPRWQTAWYLPGRRGPRPFAEQSTAQGPSRAAQLHPSGVTRGHERPTMDRRLSAVLTHVLAGRTRHRKRRSYGATLTRAAKRPRLAAAVGASTRLVAQAFFPAIQPRPAGPRYPAANLGSHPRPWPCWRMRGRVTTCRSHPWWIAQRRAGLYRESWAVQPSSAQVRVSPKARTIGPAPAARRLPLRIGTAMLGLFPHPSRANASRPRHTRRSARCGRVGSGDACPGPPLVWCWGRWLGLGWLGVARRARPHRGRRGRPPGQPRSAGRSRGAGVLRAGAQRGRRSGTGSSPGGDRVACSGGRQ